jgi:hypothetical protein
MSMFFAIDPSGVCDNPALDQYDEDGAYWRRMELNRLAILAVNPDFAADESML